MKTLIDSLYELSFNGNADYHPLGGGIIYLTQEYFSARRNNIPILGIKIRDITTGKICGFIWNSNPNEVDWDYQE